MTKKKKVTVAITIEQIYFHKRPEENVFANDLSMCRRLWCGKCAQGS